MTPCDGEGMTHDVLGDPDRRNAAHERNKRLVAWLLTGRQDEVNAEIAGLDVDDARALAATAVVFAAVSYDHMSETPMDPDEAKAFHEGVFLEVDFKLSDSENGDST